MTSSSAASWDHFWSASAAAAAYSHEGRSHPLLDEAWLQFFRLVRSRCEGPLKSLDLATGHGVVVGCLERAGPDGVEMHCLDVSCAAMASIRARFPAAIVHVADASATGLAHAHFDIVTSQFGIEYAGTRAFEEAMRLVKPGGLIGLVIHCRGGRIERDGRQARDAVARVLLAGLMENAQRFFASAFDYRAGGHELLRLQQCAAALQSSMDVSLEVVREYGAAVANQSVARLLDMANELGGCDRADTMRWLRDMEAELHCFKERMTALCDAAADPDAFAGLQVALGERDFEVLSAGLIGASEAAGPLAWCVHARKR